MAGSGTEHVRRQTTSIYVKADYRLVRIDLDRLLYAEGLKDYVKLYLEGDEHPVLSLMTLKSLEEQLPPDRFIRVHRSYIVQPSRMTCLERGRMVFGNARIPVSDTYRSALTEFLTGQPPVR